MFVKVYTDDGITGVGETTPQIDAGIQTQERIRSEADLLRILTAQDYELYLGE